MFTAALISASLAMESYRKAFIVLAVSTLVIEWLSVCFLPAEDGRSLTQKEVRPMTRVRGLRPAMRVFPEPKVSTRFSPSNCFSRASQSRASTMVVMSEGKAFEQHHVEHEGERAPPEGGQGCAQQVGRDGLGFLGDVASAGGNFE